MPSRARLWQFLVLMIFSLTAVGSAGAPPPFDLGRTPKPTPIVTLAWLGRGEAERYDGGAWLRAPAFDDEFSVVQHRYASFTLASMPASSSGSTNSPVP